jgi:serine/threonine-protein kinase PknK
MSAAEQQATTLLFPHLGDVVLERRAGSGASGEVWRASSGGRSIGVKIANAKGEAGRARLEVELHARAVLGLGAPLDGAWHGDQAALAFEWIEGTPLDRASLEQLGDLGRLGASIAACLSALADAGLRHGDVKSANVVLRDGAPYLIDLGLVAPLGEPAQGGTLAHLPPEGMSGGPLGPEADVYALAVTMRELAKRAGQSWPPDDRWRAAESKSPSFRPSARLLAGEAHTGNVSSLRAAYVLARGRDWLAPAVAGASPPLGPGGAFLRGAMQSLAGWARRRSDGAPLAPLSVEQRRALLQRVAGRDAAGWPIVRALTEAPMLEAIARASILGAPITPATFASVASLSIDEALARLAFAPGDDAALEALAQAAPTEERGPIDVAKARAAATLLRRTGRIEAAIRWARALAGSGSDPSATLLVAASERLAGRRDEASSLIDALVANEDPQLEAQIRALRIRLAIDRGALAEARAMSAASGEESAAEREALAEVRALLAWAESRHREGLDELGAIEAQDPETRARLELVRGMLLHGLGDSVAALRAFVRAGDLALAIASPPLEASARASAAAAAHDAGRLGEALEAADRAIALLATTERRADLARTRTNRARVLLALGAFADARDEALRAYADANAAHDPRGAAVAAWTVVDASAAFEKPLDAAAGDEDRARAREREASEDRARFLSAHAALGEPSIDDRLRVAAYRSRWERDAGAARARSAEELTATPETRAVLAAARLETATTAADRDAAIDEIVRQDDRAFWPALAGESLAAALGAARDAGRTELVARLHERLVALVARLSADVPSAYRARFHALRWVELAEERAPAGDDGLSAGQAELLARIARGMRDRTSLADLLRQVLDGLVLWLGVERGVLLLRAPGASPGEVRLVPRVARGLRREDLRDEQLHLSQSLARRALDGGDPVVAVDASGEASDASLTSSIHALRLRSVLAVPLIARGEKLGVVYLDDRVRRGAFGAREVAWVKLLATQAAAAIADARDALRLRRLARRAERAQERLARHLAKTEGDLEVARAALAGAGVRPPSGADPRGMRRRYDEILGESAAIRQMLRVVDRVVDASDARVPVLIVGESGTGKELVARAIHRHGPRASKGFVAENCGAIPEPLLESTLFGHVRGAFTGADRPRVGLFEVAHGGSLLLDEVGETSAAMQAKLLRALQEGEVRPVGGEATKKVDVRVIAATHRNLLEMVEQGRFREDLYYRLAVITIVVPPLRDRAEDIPLLVEHMVRRYAGARSIRVTRRALAALAAAPWPGNVRQLENELRRALVLCEETLDVEHLSDDIAASGGRTGRDGTLTLHDHVEALERRLVVEALRRANGNQTHAAKALGVSRFGLQKMMRRLSIEPGGARAGRSG